jgi:Fuc2NAc and GlcNAc transferase
MIWLAVLALLAGLISRACAAWVLRHAEALQLVQAPNHRSSHAGPTPAGGGLGVAVAGTLAGAALTMSAGGNIGWAVLLALPVAVAGFWDDVRQVSPLVRFTIQLAAVGALLAMLGKMPYVALPFHLSLHGPVLSAVLLLAGVWWINLFNFMDGIDGIAGTQAVFMLAAATGLAAWSVPASIADPAFGWMLCIAAAGAGFLLLNWPPARIFMGDVGSTYLAFAIFGGALLSIQAGWLNPASWLVLGALFAEDSTVTLITRMMRGERWVDAHRSHAYQRLAQRWARAGNGHRPVTLLAIAVNVFWLAPLAWACSAWPHLAWSLTVLAYAPLAAVAIALGAGRNDDT